MSKPSQSAVGEFPVPYPINAALALWVQGEPEAPGFADAALLLRERAIQWAQIHLSERAQNSPVHWKSPEDIAGDFLLELRARKAVDIRDAGGLKKELRRFITREIAPAAHELWELLSEALRNLLNDAPQQAWRLDAPGNSVNNHNDAIWTADPEWTQPCDEAAFLECAQQIPAIAHRAAEAARDRKNQPRVVRPSDAKQLARDLLVTAGGAVTMRQLLRAASRRVFLFTEEHVDELPEPEPEISSAVISHERLWAEADRRFARCVERLSLEDISLREVLCQYVLPRSLEGEVTARMADLGDPATINSRKDKLLYLLREAILDPSELEHGPRGAFVERAVKEITSVVLWRLLKEFCRNCGQTPTSQETTR